MFIRTDYAFEYEVNEHGHVMEVMIDRKTGRRCSESMVYGLDTDRPYTKWHGERFYLPEDGAAEAREARDTYRAWMRGYGSDPRWGWEEVE